LLLRVKGEHMKYLLTAALPITGVTLSVLTSSPPA
jgi:hypothetical protein